MQEIGAEPRVGNGSNPFSAYLKFSNIVLLGDPGAGKTHLFTEFAGFEEGGFRTARSFLNVDTKVLTENKTLFIDGLDERRSRRGDDSAIDEMVRKLVQVSPARVRISCRAADWLGDTDLAAFRDYFDGAGGCIVLSLQPLSKGEQIEVLTASAIEDPAAFLTDAQDRGLGDLLGNPQNLTMLADVVRKRSWPATRAELFKQAVDVLLEEPNRDHSRQRGGHHSASELFDIAGELCAARLISDIQAISLTESDRANDLPSYRSISTGDRSKALVVLGRRVFAATAITEAVDYAHRTIAEYHGASWLASKIRSGLPIGRVRALIGVDGRPATELRGLHAWLAVHLPEHAETLISADPFGILTYADARAYTPALRKHLLQALAKLADVDPWFRDGHWSSASIAGLAGADMVEGFRSILSSADANFSLRMLVLDSLSAGQPVPELSAELQSLILNSSTSYAERSASVEALLHSNNAGESLLAKTYVGIGKSAEDTRLKAMIFKRLGSQHFRIDALAELFLDVLLSKAKVSFDVLYGITASVPDLEVCEALDQLVVCSARAPSDCIRDNVWSLEGEFDRLLFRALEIDSDVDGNRLLRWLDCRQKVTNRCGDSRAQDVQTQLAAHPATAQRGIDAAIQAVNIDEGIWTFVHRLRGLGLIGWVDTIFLGRAFRAFSGELVLAKKVYLYELALNVAVQIGLEARVLFENLVDCADDDSSLEAVRQACCFQDISEWRLEDAERSRERAVELEDTRARNRADFESHAASIRSGTNLGWLGWIARVHFALFSDITREATPRARLVVELGEKNAELAAEGMIALVRRGEITQTGEVLRMHGENKHCWWWYAVIAGLDLYVEQGGQVGDLTDEYLQTALAIDSLCTTFVYKGNVSSQYVHPWKMLILKDQPTLAVGAYRALARFDLARSAQSAYGLHDLLHEDLLQPYRAGIALALLTEFPNAPIDSLRRLIQVAMSECDVTLFLPVLRDVIARGLDRDDALILWLAAGYIVSPSDFIYFCTALDEGGVVSLIWALRDVSGYSRRTNKQASILSSQQLEQMLRWVFGQFPRTSHPEGGWGGDSNAWDATDFALRLIALLSSDPSNEAAVSLQCLAAEPRAQTYLDDIKHAIAQQRMRMIDAQYQQPSYLQVVTTLANGSPASIADLHALLLDHLEDLKPHIASSNLDVFKQFWNEDRYGKVASPKNEESCRDCLTGLLRVKTRPQKISLEPEGHMAADKRADIVALLPGMKLVIELKRDYHAKVWVAIQEQLERFYTRDPEAQGFGIYVILWFGSKRKTAISLPPLPFERPGSASEMQGMLQALVPAERRNKIGVVVLDVSGEIPTVG